MPEVYIGAFGAEAAWRPASAASLTPLLFDALGDASHMDEAMSLACGPGDRFVVREPPSPILEACFRRTGLAWNPVLAAKDAAEPTTRFASDDRAALFAVTPATVQFCRELGLRLVSPSIEVVARVNSKSWSFRARELAGARLGELARSSAEAREKGRRLLQSGSLFVKEAYGVSGLGNVVVASAARLDAVCRGLQAQEARGLRVDVVLEPLLDKTEDFSGHFVLERDGSWRFVGFRTMVNVGSRYLASRAMAATAIADAGRSSYENILGIILGSLAADGYFGPVCVDGLRLRDGTLQPVIEVNARMSMGLLNLRLDETLSPAGLMSTLVKVRVQASSQALSVMDALVAAGLLPNTAGEIGVLPLTSSAARRGDRVTEALFAILHNGPEAERELCRSLETALGAGGLNLALPGSIADLIAPPRG